MAERVDLQTVTNMMDQLEDEIADIKAGTLPESTGRLVLGYRREQIKTAALNLQYRRLVRNGGDRELRLKLPKETIPIEKPEDENKT